MALLLKVADRVSEGARKVDLAQAALGGAVADPAAVHARCYGTGLEKALYLEALLAAAGFKDARLAALMPPDSGFSKDACLPAVKEWRVRVPGPDADVLVGPDGGLAVTNDPGACLVRDGRTGELLSKPEGRPARLAFQCRVKDWDGGRCKLEGTLELAGRLFKAERMAGDAGKEAEKLVGELLHDWGAEKIQVKVHGGGVQGLSCSFTAETSALFRASGNFRSVSVPVPAVVSAWRDLYRVPERHTAFQLPVAPLSVRVDLSVDLPPGMTLEYVPGTLTASNVAGGFSQEVSADAKQVTLRRTTDVPKALLPAAECAGFKKVMASWFTESQGEIILKAAK